jgi:hypothetical protein
VNLAAKISSGLSKLVGPNSAHVIDGLVAWELTAVATAAKSESARDYGAAHPWMVVFLTLGPPALTGLAARFRKAATDKSPAAGDPQK